MEIETWAKLLIIWRRNFYGLPNMKVRRYLINFKESKLDFLHDKASRYIVRKEGTKWNDDKEPAKGLSQGSETKPNVFQ